MVAILTLVAPSGECYELKVGVVSFQCNNCVIHTRFRGELLTAGRYTNPSSFPSICRFHGEGVQSMLIVWSDWRLCTRTCTGEGVAAGNGKL